MLTNYRQNQSSVPWVLWSKGIYAIIFTFSRATRISFIYQFDRQMKKTQMPW